MIFFFSDQGGPVTTLALAWSCQCLGLSKTLKDKSTKFKEMIANLSHSNRRDKTYNTPIVIL